MSKLHIAFSFPSSGGAWSTGASPLQSWFLSDNTTPGAGNIWWYGATNPTTDAVNGAGVIFTFTADGLVMTLG